MQSYRCVLVVMDLQQFGGKKLQKFSTEVETALARVFLLNTSRLSQFRTASCTRAAQ